MIPSTCTCNYNVHVLKYDAQFCAVFEVVGLYSEWKSHVLIVILHVEKLPAYML